MINGGNSVYFNSQTSNGSWAGWSAVGVGVGASSISTGVIQVSTSPAIFEPYVFMINGANDVYYNQRTKTGTWTGWSAVGLNVGASSIAAVTYHNQPTVSMLNGGGSIYLNSRISNGAWSGWSQVGTSTGATPAVQMAAVAADSVIYNFAVNHSAQINSTFGIQGSTTAWTGLGPLPGAVSPTTIAVTSDSAMAPFAFTIGADNKVYWNDQSSWATWSQWASLARRARHDPPRVLAVGFRVMRAARTCGSGIEPWSASHAARSIRAPRRPK